MKKFTVFLVTILSLVTTLSAQTQIQLPLQVPESAVITAPAASAVGSGGSCTVGAHSFAVSFVTNSGDETGIGNAVSATCVSSDSVSLSVIPLGSNNVTARNIYATKAGTTSPFYLVSSNTIANNTATTYTFTLADTSLGAQLTAHATPTPKTLWSLWSNGQLSPMDDNKYSLGGSVNRVTNVFTFSTNYSNATSGSVAVTAPTGALGTPTVLLPALSGPLPVAYACGNALAANAACANTATGSFHIIFGSATLGSNTSTLTGISPAYTSSTSFWCIGNDTTTRANPVQVVPASGSTVTITNTTGASDVISFACFGS